MGNLIIKKQTDEISMPFSKSIKIKDKFLFIPNHSPISFSEIISVETEGQLNQWEKDIYMLIISHQNFG